MIGITGSPASGKSTFAKSLKSEYKGLIIIDISSVARKYGAYSSRDRDGTLVADMKKLRLAIKKEMDSAKGSNVAIVGHMVQDMHLKLDICITIRAKPNLLYSRQKARSYSMAKIKENIISEALDYCGINASKSCRFSFEVETAEEKGRLIKYFAALMEHNKGIKDAPLPKRIEALMAKKDMMKHFVEFIRKNNIGL
ncbi:MAG: AAA family ATPase [Candidatus Micrarchaeia archaeon]